MECPNPACDNDKDFKVLDYINYDGNKWRNKIKCNYCKNNFTYPPKIDIIKDDNASDKHGQLKMF